jgi:hypothetical protein
MIFVLLPVHNHRADAEAFGRALAQQGMTQLRLILLDDGSTDGTAEAVCAIFPETTVLRGSGDWWWGGALHHAWQWLNAQEVAADDVIIVCNDDVDLPDGFIAHGLDLLAQNPGALVIAKVWDEKTGTPSESCYAIEYSRCYVALATQGEEVRCGPTRGLFIRWADMHKIGGFHPRLLPHYLSDLEWTARARRRGLSLVRDDRLWLVEHRDRTGLHDLARVPRAKRVKLMFSRRYAGNPLHWVAFVLLVFPPRHQPAALARIGQVALLTVLAKTKGSQKTVKDHLYGLLGRLFPDGLARMAYRVLGARELRGRIPPARLFDLAQAIEHDLAGGDSAETLRWQTECYSQEGEDLLVARLFGDKTDGFYVDVGAHHFARFSNTLLLYRKGWRGINIDATPGSMADFVRFRPRDINIECLVAADPAPRTFFMLDEPALNTASKDLVELREREHVPFRVTRTATLRPRTLGSLLAEHVPAGQAIDLLSVDVEGLDLDVLTSNDWSRFRPTIVMVELLTTSLDEINGHEVVQFLRRYSYRPIAKLYNTVVFR